MSKKKNYVYGVTFDGKVVGFYTTEDAALAAAGNFHGGAVVKLEASADED